MTKYIIWGSHEHGQYCLARSTDLNNIFGEGKLPNWGTKQLVSMLLPNDDAAIFMYKSYFEALEIQAGAVLSDHVGLPVWSKTDEE